MRNLPIHTRTRSRLVQMMDVIWEPVDGDTFIYNAALWAFEFSLGWGGIYGDAYDSAAFTVGSWTTNYDVATQQITLFDSVPSAKYLRLTTTANIDIKINTIVGDAIPVTTTENPFEIALSGITNIFITTAGSNADIRIVLVW